MPFEHEDISNETVLAQHYTNRVERANPFFNFNRIKYVDIMNTVNGYAGAENLPTKH